MAVQPVFLRPGRWFVGAILLGASLQSPALAAPSGRLEETLEGRCTHISTHELILASGDYVRAWLEAHGDLTTTVLDPAGSVIVTANLGPDAIAPLAFVAHRSGTYEIGVACDPRLAPTTYALQLEVQGAASGKDLDSVGAARTFLAAEELARHWQKWAKQQALQTLTPVLTMSQKLGDRSLEARTLLRLADLHLSLGEAQTAVTLYEKAVVFGEGLSVRVVGHLGAARALLRLDEPDEALQHVRQALALNRSERVLYLQAKVLTTLGIGHYHLEQLGRSLDLLRQARLLWHDLDRRGESEALLHMGFAYSDLSQERESLDCQRRALAIAQKVGDRRLEAVILTAIGNVHSKMGEKQQALDSYYQATPMLESIGDPYWTVSVYSGMGYVYDQLGDKERALGYYARAVEINRKISSDQDVGANLVHLGRTHLSMGEIEKALTCYQEAWEIFRKLGLTRMESVALSHLGEAYSLLGHQVEALNHYSRALELYEVSGYKREEANTLNKIGRIEEQRARVEAALGYYRRALALSRETQDRFVESQSLLNLARVARMTGDLDQARENAEDALRLVEGLREDVASYSLRASYFASVHELHEFYVDLLMELHRRHPSKGFDVQAFEASETARARSLLEMLSEERPSQQTLDPQLLAREEQLEAKIRELAGTGKLGGHRDREKELSGLLAELDRVRVMIRSESAARPSLGAEPETVESLRGELDSSTLLLSYFLGSEHSYLWVLGNSGLAAYELPPRQEIERRVQDLYRLLTARERKEEETAKEFYERTSESDREFWRSASTLSHILLGPVAEDLHGQRLVVIGDGALHHFPFSALPRPRLTPDADPTPLIADHEIVRLPSASILVALKARDFGRPQPPKTLAILADPVFDGGDPRVEGSHATTQQSSTVVAALPVSRSVRDLSRALADVPIGGGESVPRLLASRQEAQEILDLVPPDESLAALGFEASRALATSHELTDYRVVHFATHGILNTEHPELSGIILSLVDQYGHPQDGFLRLHDIETLELPVDLVVLSACSTGLGKEVKGEGMIGLVRGFMSAGADRVLASYWNVDDEATSELMKRFYRHLFTKGMTVSAALRAAQRSMSADRRWRSPFYWAAFELQGRWE